MTVSVMGTPWPFAEAQVEFRVGAQSADEFPPVEDDFVAEYECEE
jgi:hypothetical protein